MKAVCINDRWPKTCDPDPKVGDIVTIKSSFQWGAHLIYTLEEFPRTGGYDAAGFAPLSDIDEKEFERNYNFQTV